MTLLASYYNQKKLHLFIGIVLANLIIIWISKVLLINEIVFYNTFSEQFTYDRSIKLFEDLKRIAWLSYIFSPIMLLIKLTLVSIVLYIGIVFCNFHEKVTFSSVFKVVLASEIIYVFAGFIKFLWFYLFAGNYDLNDIGFFYPLSLINLFKITEVSKIWVLPLQTVNLFQIVYIISLSYGLKKVCKIDTQTSDKIVLLSYIPALVLWVAFIMFLTIDSAV